MAAVLPAEAYDVQRMWDAGGGVDTKWSTAANWDTAVPLTGDRAFFYIYGYAANLDANQQVSDAIIWNQSTTPWAFSGTATLTVTNDFTLSWGNYTTARSTFAPVLNALRLLGDNSTGDRPFSWHAGLNFSANGNTIGSMWLRDNSAFFTGNANTFNGGITLFGMSDRPESAYYEWSGGKVSIEGTGNSYGVGQFTLNRGGNLTITKDANLTFITNLAFNGGTLQLGENGAYRSNTFPVYPQGINVAKGTLWLYGESALGAAAANALTLGSAGYFGTLRGLAPGTGVGQRIDRPITLAGNGGVIDALYNWTGYYMRLGSVISGPGELVAVGNNYVEIDNGVYAVSTSNTYGGGTRLAAGVMEVQNLRTLGTGTNVYVANGARLSALASTTLTPGTTVHLSGWDKGKAWYPAVLEVNGDFLPAIAGDAVGLLSIDANSGANINTRLQSPMGQKVFLGSIGNSTISATQMAPNPDGVYRAAGALNGTGIQTFSGLNAFTGNNSLEIGVPNDLLDSWKGLVQITASNSYSGLTTIHAKSMVFFNAATDSTSTPLGSPSGDVKMYTGGQMQLRGMPGAFPLVKNALIAQGGNPLLTVWNQGASGTVQFNSFTRQSNSVISLSAAAGDLGGTERIKFLSGVPASVNGMVAPYFINAGWAPPVPTLVPSAFVDYNGASGFIPATYSLNVTAATFPAGVSAGTDVVSVKSGGLTCTLQDNPYVYALQITNAVKKGVGTKVTIGSGGLIINKAAPYQNNWGANIHISDVDMVFGTVSGPTTNLAEALIYTDGTTAYWSGPELAGKLYCAGLTKSGPGWLRLSADNTTAIQGPVVINNGTLSFSTDGKAFGPSANTIVLNGGQLAWDFWADGFQLCQLFNKFQIGPSGGLLRDLNSINGPGYYEVLWNKIEDLVPGDAGPLCLTGGNFIFAGTNTSSGGLVLSGTSWLQYNQAAPASLGVGPVRLLGANGLDLSCSAGTNLVRVSLDHPGARFGIQANAQGIGSLEGVGYVQFGDYVHAPGNLTLTVGGDNTDFTFYGTLMEAQARLGHVVKTGNGRWTLYGDHGIHGNVTVAQGTLDLAGAFDYAAAMTVAPGATLTGKGGMGAASLSPLSVNVNGGTLSGDLQIVGTVVVSNGATLGGRVSVTGAGSSLTFGSSAAVSVNIDRTGVVGPTASGTINVSGVTLNLALSQPPANVGQEFVIFNNVGGGAITGTFAGYPNGSIVSLTAGGKTYYFKLSYTGGDGNDVTLTSLPQGTMVIIK
jgi:autotransporter-associated beta strand protein